MARQSQERKIKFIKLSPRPRQTVFFEVSSYSIWVPCFLYRIDLQYSSNNKNFTKKLFCNHLNVYSCFHSLFVFTQLPKFCPIIFQHLTDKNKRGETRDLCFQIISLKIAVFLPFHHRLSPLPFFHQQPHDSPKDSFSASNPSPSPSPIHATGCSVKVSGGESQNTHKYFAHNLFRSCLLCFLTRLRDGMLGLLFRSKCIGSTCMKHFYYSHRCVKKHQLNMISLWYSQGKCLFSWVIDSNVKSKQENKIKSVSVFTSHLGEIAPGLSESSGTWISRI